MRKINERYVQESFDEKGLLTRFRATYPDSFNFGYDIVDDIAENDPDRPAMVWCNPEGEEHRFTFADARSTGPTRPPTCSPPTASGRGDMVMVILRHYQFWFVATALDKLGAVMVPATFMLKEHDLSYPLEQR